MLDTKQSYLIVGKDKEKNWQKIKDLAKSLDASVETNSPDVIIITPSKNLISIDEIRQLKKIAYQKPVQQNYRLVVIKEANLLSTEAQNSLLKILEEPPATTIIILEAKNRYDFLHTVLSRLKILTVSADIKNLTLKDDLDSAIEQLNASQDLKGDIDKILTNKYILLQEKIKTGKNISSTVKEIEEFNLANKMLTANVSRQFVTLQLVLNLNNLASNSLA